MVWGSRSSASTVAAAVQPWTSSQTACHRSRSLGVGARIILSMQGLGIHLPLFQIPMYLSRTHHQPLSERLEKLLCPFANLPHVSAHFTLALV